MSKIETFPGAIAGQANGVPYVALPPGGERKSVPVVVAWHLQDPPRTEAAFAAALPLRGLEAWRLYLGLPLSGSRLPAGGADEVMRLGQEDAVLNLQKPWPTAQSKSSALHWPSCARSSISTPPLR